MTVRRGTSDDSGLTKSPGRGMAWEMSLWAVRRFVHFLGRAGSSGTVSMNTPPRALRANLLRARRPQHRDANLR